MFSMFPPGHPLHGMFAAIERQRRVIQASDLPLNFLRHTLLRVASVVIEHSERATLVGIDGGDVWICTCGCQEGLPGTYTVISDVEIIETFANKNEVTNKTTCAYYQADGRAALIIPGHETPNPW